MCMKEITVLQELLAGLAQVGLPGLTTEKGQRYWAASAPSVGPFRFVFPVRCRFGAGSASSESGMATGRFGTELVPSTEPTETFQT